MSRRNGFVCLVSNSAASLYIILFNRAESLNSFLNYEAFNYIKSSKTLTPSCLLIMRFTVLAFLIRVEYDRIENTIILRILTFVVLKIHDNYTYTSYQLSCIKASQSLSKTVVFSHLAHTCTTTLAALDGVIQLGRDHFILSI